jgi:hypothetical protein
LALDAGLLLGTNLVTRPLLTGEPARKIGLVWRQGSGRRDEFHLLATERSERAKAMRKSFAREWHSAALVEPQIIETGRLLRPALTNSLLRTIGACNS